MWMVRRNCEKAKVCQDARIFNFFYEVKLSVHICQQAFHTIGIYRSFYYRYFRPTNRMKSVLITDDCHPLLMEGLEAAGLHCDFRPDITLAETQEVIEGYSGLIINSKILVDRAFLDRAVQLQFIGRLGSGMEIVDREYASQKGVHVFSSPEGNRNAVAEQALGMLLTLSNNLLRADAEVRRKEWHREANRGWELRGKTLGIIGFGHTGSQFAKKMAGMEMKVLGYDRYLNDYSEGMPWVLEVDRLEEILERADIISLHLPLTVETKHFVDAQFIQRCKPGFILINTSRGACVDTGAVVAGLASGQIGGACLDVYENEKPSTYTELEAGIYQQLFRFPNVVLTPHIAGWTHESKRLLAKTLLQKIKGVL